MHIIHLSLLVSLIFPVELLAAPEWITYPGLDGHQPVVLHFRREFKLAQKPSAFPVEISADNRFVLYVNGHRAAAGPARGDLAHWRSERVDLASFLEAGQNVLAAEVWNAATPKSSMITWTAPLAQITALTGFWLSAPGDASAQLDSGTAWRVSVLTGHDFSSPMQSFIKGIGFKFYAAGGQETIDGTKADWQWAGATESDAKWTDAVSAVAHNETTPGKETTPWTLMVDPLPQMEYRAADPGKTVRTDQEDATNFPTHSVVIAPHREVHVLLDRRTMISAYPHLTVSGGAGSKIEVTYAEALYDEHGHKGDRNEVGNRRAVGVTDTFLPDGGDHRRYSPLWWRTWRYMQLTVTTTDDPLTLNGLAVDETGYPFGRLGDFKSSDAQLNEMWDIGWRTQRIDSHETFMDSAYWEQLQYTGDSRIQMLTVYPVSGDTRLPI